MKKLFVVAFLLAGLALQADAVRADSVTTISTFAGDSAIALDASGNPVIAYRDAFTTRLKILHCNDPICAPGGDTVNSPDLQPGQWPSIRMDASGNPVISYYSTMFDRLKLLHCNDPNCASGGDTVTVPDPGTFLLEWQTSLALDASGNPVIAYAPPYEIRVLHCNDPFCTGNDETITSNDSSAAGPSMALDALGKPVVAYFKGSGGVFSTGSLRVMHCNDVNCAPGGDTVTAPEPGPGITPSLRLDASGMPVLAYYTGTTTRDLRIMHCNDVNCSGTNESITTPDATGDAGGEPALVLDGGLPVVTYRDETNGDLKLLRCNDVNCDPGGDTRTSLDTAADSGDKSSLIIDGAGNPAITFDAGTDLHLIRCDTPACASAVGGMTRLPGVAPSSSGGLSSPAFVPFAALALVALASIAFLRRRRA